MKAISLLESFDMQVGSYVHSRRVENRVVFEVDAMDGRRIGQRRGFEVEVMTPVEIRHMHVVDEPMSGLGLYDTNGPSAGGCVSAYDSIRGEPVVIHADLVPYDPRYAVFNSSGAAVHRYASVFVAEVRDLEAGMSALVLPCCKLWEWLKLDHRTNLPLERLSSR
jgi:hypothetical protein